MAIERTLCIVKPDAVAKNNIGNVLAMIEGSGVSHNSYSVMEIAPTGTIQLTGFRQQNSYDWKPRS